MTMSHWVLVPEAFHSGKKLESWVKAAYDLNAEAPAKAAVKKKVKKAAKKK